MAFYDDLVAGIKASFGDGTPFDNYTELARHCGVSPTQMYRYINGQSKSTLLVIGKILDGIGARLVFPHDRTQHKSSAPDCPEIIKERDHYRNLYEQKVQELLRAQGSIAALEKQIVRLAPSPNDKREDS